MNDMQLENQLLCAKWVDGELSALTNVRTGEAVTVRGDRFEVETPAALFRQQDLRLSACRAGDRDIVLEFVGAGIGVTVRYTIGADHHFLEKSLAVRFDEATALTRVTLGRWRLNAPGLRTVCYRHPDFEFIEAMPNHRKLVRPPNTEASRTFFCRAARGSFFAGVELAYDASALIDGTIVLALAPNLRLAAGERFDIEPAYLGVSCRGGQDAAADRCRPYGPVDGAYGLFSGAEAAGTTGNGLADDSIHNREQVKGRFALPAAAVVYGPLDRNERCVALERLGRGESPPASVEIGGREFVGSPRTFDERRDLNLADLLPLPPKPADRTADQAAYLAIPFTVVESGPATFGFGADWWYEAWLDGEPLSDSYPRGNGSYPLTIGDHAATRDCAAGAHILVVRFVRGSASAQLCVGGPDDIRKALDAGRIQAVYEAPQNLPEPVYPLPSESAAMTAMAAAIFGPPRHGFMATACGWHCQMEHNEYSDQSLAADLVALRNIAACGLDFVSDSHPWGGETEKMNRLVEGGTYVPGAAPRRFLEEARRQGLNVILWPTMNNTHAWPGPPNGAGRPFRPDRPDWRRGSRHKKGAYPTSFMRAGGNCMGHTPFVDWLETIHAQALATGLFGGWAMDGDFWGMGGYYTLSIPVTCDAENHTHLAPDANYACQRNLDRLVAAARRLKPDVYIITCRPQQDLGVWANRNVDAVFTLIETGTGRDNILSGNEIRTCSRIRVHHHFFPHWMDWPLLFPSNEACYAGNTTPPWPAEGMDYILLSAMSCSPNLMIYLPARDGLHERDRNELRKWLDWGRANSRYLMVRKDLPDWPAPGRVDGSAHLVDDAGLIFLFNPNEKPMTGEFALTEESIGLTGAGEFSIAQEHPAPGRTRTARTGETLRWEVPAGTAVVLRLSRVGGRP